MPPRRRARSPRNAERSGDATDPGRWPGFFLAYGAVPVPAEGATPAARVPRRRHSVMAP
ncbi:Uncharacterised protein [Bordetella pertussis]|nr:Uncharacterised protein [Bordetella pertussis]